MQNWQPTNPVDRRLMTAHEDWLSFATDRRARLLYWHVDEADLELVRAYFQSQQDRSSAVLRLASPFDSAAQYGNALAKEIVAFYDARRAGSTAMGVTADWTPPQRRSGQSSSRYLLMLTDSLIEHHPEVFPGLVLILEPTAVSDTRGFETWLNTLLPDMESVGPTPGRMRLVQFGTVSDPLKWLRARQPDRVRVVHGHYSMRAVPRELVAQSGERGPSGQFRRLFVELSETLVHDDPKRLESLRGAALEVAQQQRWFDQSAVVHLLAAAAYLKWQSHDLALIAYRQATQSGFSAQTAGHAAGNKLIVNGLFGEAGVHLTCRRYLDAARCYGEASSYAEADRDGILAVEARRMQAWCLEMDGRHEPALDAALMALDAGQWVEPPLRANSNLQLVAAWLIRRTGFMERSHRRYEELVPRLKRLYGDNWREAIKPLVPHEVSRAVAARADEGDAQ
jgi:hypothetical protein